MDNMDFKPRLRHVNFTFSKHCNLRCKMCGYTDGAAGFNELDTKQVKDILRDCKELGLEDLTLSGGEPMMRNDIYDIISYAASIGVKTSMVSNGTLIDEDNVKKLIQSGLTTVIFSIEGFEETNDYIRGKGNFQKTINSFHIIKNFEDKLDVIKAGVVISKYNYKNLFDFTKFLFEDVGINAISYNPFDKNIMGAYLYEKYHDEIDITPEIIPEVSDQLEKIISYSKTVNGSFQPESYLRKIKNYFAGEKMLPKLPCHVPLEGCGISCDGTVYPCWSEYRAAGNVAEQSIKDIVVSPAYQQECKKALEQRCNGCLSSCYPDIHE